MSESYLPAAFEEAKTLIDARQRTKRIPVRHR